MNWSIVIFKNESNASKFFLVGGIGNQLFIFFAGIAHSLSVRRNVEFVLPDSNKPSNLLSQLNVNAYKFKTLDLYSKSIVKKGLELYPKLGRIFGIPVYLSDDIGFDQNILVNSRNREFHGYFQSFLYLDLIPEDVKLNILQLRKESNWFLEMKRNILIEKPNVIHVRRGDYNNLKLSHGVIAADYYLDAIHLTEKLNPGKPYWVFSDEISKVMFDFKHLFPKGTRWIRPPNESSALESLFLMSYGSSNVIANSTYSWWSAYLNSSSTITIAPSDWFRGMEDPIKLIPDNWIKVKNSWIN